MDGFGHDLFSKSSAILEAKTPHLDALMAKYPSTQIEPEESSSDSQRNRR